MGRSRKPLWVMPTVGSNPTVSAIVIAPRSESSDSVGGCRTTRLFPQMSNAPVVTQNIPCDPIRTTSRDGQ